MDMEEGVGPFLTNLFGDRYFYSVNRGAFNRVGSDALYEGMYGELLTDEHTLNIFIGTDSGILLNKVKSSALPEGSRFIFLELPQILERLESEGFFEELDEQILCIHYEGLRKLEEILPLNDYFFLNKVNLIESLAARDAFLAEYRELYWNCRQDLERWQWEVDAGLGNEVFITTQLTNLGENRIPVNCLKQKFVGKTAVLLGGGPSLDEMLPWVLENREHIALLAVSRISRRLLEVGLTPDIIFSIDPHDVSFDVSKEMLLLWEHSLFVNYYHVVPSLLSQWRGRCLYAGPRLPWTSRLNIETFDAPGPTVTHFAFNVAIEMGFSEIILAGVDLCFSTSGHSHAKGSNEHLAGPQFGDQQLQVETNGGGMASTAQAMALGIPIFGKQAKLARDRGCKVFNVALGAARIEYVEYRRIEDLTVQSLSEPVTITLASVLPEETPDSRAAYYKDALRELNWAQTQLKKIRTLAEGALDCNDGLFGRNGHQASFKYKIRMDKIEKRLNTELKDMANLVKKMGVRDFLKTTSLSVKSEWSDEEVERIGRIYYESYRASADRLLSLVEECRNRLFLRLEEEKIHPDFSFLFEHWHQNREPGRALVWQNLHLETWAHLPIETRNHFREFETAFGALLQTMETNHLWRSKSKADPTVARGNCLIMFLRRDQTGLEQLAQGLGTMEGPVAQSVRHLALGYLAELDNDPVRALKQYQQAVLQETGPAVEDALRRISSVALQEGYFDDALMALECLVSLSPTYLPFYADLHKVLSDTPKALDLYADYLEKVPTDVAAMLKLGKIYLDLGVFEGAKLMFSCVLAIDSDNKAAKALLGGLE